MFTADLMRALHVAQAGRSGKYIGIDVDFMRCESYVGESRGELRLGAVGRYGAEAMRCVTSTCLLGSYMSLSSWPIGVNVSIQSVAERSH